VPETGKDRGSTPVWPQSRKRSTRASRWRWHSPCARRRRLAGGRYPLRLAGNLDAGVA